MGKIPHDPNEILAVVDGRDRIIGKATRRAVHLNGYKHREVCVLLVNSKNRILLQKRTDNGLIDCSAAGHFPHNQGYLDAAVRETKEELGIDVPKSKFVAMGKFRINARDGTNDRFVSVFEVRDDNKVGDMKIDRAEVDWVRRYSMEGLRSIIKNKRGTQGFMAAAKFYMRKKRALRQAISKRRARTL